MRPINDRLFLFFFHFISLLKKIRSSFFFLFGSFYCLRQAQVKLSLPSSPLSLVLFIFFLFLPLQFPTCSSLNFFLSLLSNAHLLLQCQFLSSHLWHVLSFLTGPSLSPLSIYFASLYPNALLDCATFNLLTTAHEYQLSQQQHQHTQTHTNTYSHKRKRKQKA